MQTILKMNRKILTSSALILVTLLLSCTSSPSHRSTDNSKDTVAVQKHYADTVPLEKREGYEGSFECNGNCKAIHVLLIIAPDYQSYELSEDRVDDYYNEDEDFRKTKGKLNTERGYEDDADATVYILNYDLPANKQRYFVRLTGKDEVFEIGSDRKRFTDGKNHTLTRKEDW